MTQLHRKNFQNMFASSQGIMARVRRAWLGKRMNVQVVVAKFDRGHGFAGFSMQVLEHFLYSRLFDSYNEPCQKPACRRPSTV